MRDPYSVLGVPKDASRQNIKSAFRRLAKKHHPDRNREDPSAQAKFAEVNRAYEIIGDEKRRTAFDRGEIDAEGKERFHGFEGASADPFAGFRRAGGGHFEFRTSGGGSSIDAGGADIFGELFGRAGASSARPQKGADLEASLAVTLEEVASAARVTAILPEGRKVAVKLPRFVEDGQVIRLKGRGHPPPVGQVKGDALVKLRFKRHPKYGVDGRDLHGYLNVGLQDAVLGAKLPFETLSGKVAVTVPPWSGSGKTFRLKGRGLPKKDGSKGDLFVELRVELPERDAELEALMRKRRS